MEQWLGVLRIPSLSIRSTPSNCSTTHSYPTRYAATTSSLQIPIELLILQHNFNKEQSSLMMIWQDRNMSECFKVFLKVFYMKLYVHSLVDKLKWSYENARCYNKIYTLSLCSSLIVSDKVLHPYKTTVNNIVLCLYTVTSSCIVISRHYHVLWFCQHLPLVHFPY